ncbi:MAG: phosphoribosylaminoimidazolesuccinocarboxamide synthase, partial [Methanothrix sp.]|nr:phosphoribosylaminoimidazolesuccinocarboxamide synthase [Methanothrix sp.]
RAARMGIKTHFLEYLPPAGMLCKKVDILQPAQITPQSKNYLIPLEWICRWYVAGSLYDRVKEGKLSAKDLGFASGHAVKLGEPLPQPFLEVSTKLEKTDRLLKKEEALQISGLSPQEYDQAREIVLDGKKELAFDENRQIMVIDVYGTADEDRFWDKARYEAGELVDLSKEYVRQHYRQSGYKDRLYAARDAGQPEPAIPALPPEVVAETSRIYIRLFEMITGESFQPAGKS